VSLHQTEALQRHSGVTTEALTRLLDSSNSHGCRKNEDITHVGHDGRDGHDERCRVQLRPQILLEDGLEVHFVTAVAARGFAFATVEVANMRW